MTNRYGPPPWLGIGFIITFILFFGLFFGLMMKAFGETPPIRLQVNVVHGVAPISVTKKEAKMLFKKATRVVRDEVNVRLIARKWRSIRQENYAFRQTDPIDVYDRIRLDAQRGFYAVHYPTIFLSAPALDTGNLRIFGATDGYSCEHINWKHSCAAVIRMPEDVGNEWAQSVTALVHEIGHLLGAHHTFEEYDSVMDASALTLLPENNYRLHFTNTSKEQIRQCTRSLN